MGLATLIGTTFSLAPAEGVVSVVIGPDLATSTQQAMITDRINEVFNDPIAVQVAKCESNLLQFTNGTTTRGKIDPDDTGTFQINKRYHQAKAIELGLNLEATEDNIAYAKWLYDREGWEPWKWSKHCWNFPGEKAIMK